MLLSDRRFFLLGAAASLLTACGFEPVYKDGAKATNLRNQIAIDLVTGRNGFELRERLEERLGKASDTAPYVLTFDLSTNEGSIAVTATSGTTRKNLTGIARFTIRRVSTGQIVFEDSVKSITAYSTTSETYPSRVAQRDANVRLSQTLAERIADRIAITAKDWHQ